MSGPPSASPPDPSRRARVAQEWDRLVSEFIEGYLAANPTTAVWLGRHDFDGRLPDWSRAGLEAEARRLLRARTDALAFRPEELDGRRGFEREHLLAVADGELFWREGVDWPHRSPTFYAWALDPNVYLSREYAPIARRRQAFLDWLGAIPEAVSRIRENLRGPMPGPLLDVGRASFGGLAAYLEQDVPRGLEGNGDAGLETRFAGALEAAVAELRRLEAWLAGLEPARAEEAGLGEVAFAEMLRATERVEQPIEELERWGRDELERDLAALEEACAAFAPGAAVEEAIARMRARKPPDGPVACAGRQLESLLAFVRERELVTIPEGPAALVAESPPYMRWNPAYIDIPGPFERPLPAVFYLAPPDPTWSREERDAYLPGEADLLFVSAHEVWPGHYLHYLHANRAESPLGRAFISYAFSEGWAHYAEELLCEAGFGASDPETRIGHLVNSLLRTVRFVVAIGLHAGDLSLTGAERLFRELAFQDPAGARQQAARGAFDPAYLNYTLGKLLIRRLREEWTAARGGRSAWREFHDRLLSFGGPPLPLVRGAMLREPAGD